MTTKPEPKMMGGSQTSNSYFVFARKGSIALGIKPYGIHKGSMFGADDCTYFLARLRSAPAGGMFDEEKKAAVVKLQKTPATLWDAWPKVEWEKKSEERASTGIGIFLRGKFGKDVEQMKKLLEGFDNGKMTNKMADYLIELAGPENLIVTKRDLQQWLEGQYSVWVNKIVDSIKKSEALAAEVEQQVGVFGMQQTLLKKIYGDKNNDEMKAADDLNAEEQTQSDMNDAED